MGKTLYLDERSATSMGAIASASSTWQAGKVTTLATSAERPAPDAPRAGAVDELSRPLPRWRRRRMARC